MNCQYCNTPIPNGAAKCPVCGNAISANSAPPPVKEAAPNVANAGKTDSLLTRCNNWIDKNAEQLKIRILMAATILLLLGFIVLIWPTRYEYREVAVASTSNNDFKPCEISLSAALKANKGWELVSAVPVTETVYPNFGRSDYVTGIKPNTRTGKIVLIFRKRTLF